MSVPRRRRGGGFWINRPRFLLTTEQRRARYPPRSTPHSPLPSARVITPVVVVSTVVAAVK